MEQMNVYLRALEVSDVEKCYFWHNDPELNQYLGGVFRFVSKSSEEDWLKKRTSYSTGELNLAICLKSSNEHIGNIYAKDINWVNRNAALHLFLGDKKTRGHGYGSQALQLMIKHCFYDLNLEKLYLHVFEENVAAVKCYLKSGFIIEGTLRKHYFKALQFKNVLILGLLREQYISK